MEDGQLYQGLGRVEGKIDLLLSTQTRIERRLDEQDERLKILEGVHQHSTGVFATLGKMAGWYYAIIAAAFGLFAADIKAYFFKL